MFTRLIGAPNNSFFLFGPRGTGKSTWLRNQWPSTLDGAAVQYIDLLDTSNVLTYSTQPGLLYKQLSSTPKGSWVVLDEVQKVPSLLDEVHRLIEDKKLKFVLSGSSARQLKRAGVNLLAGRAFLLRMFPLVSAEVNYQLNADSVLATGTLPAAFNNDDAKLFLASYAQVYLKEEIYNEGLTRNLGGFARFLEIAARQNGQITNVSSIARDAMVARQTVQGYFDVLVDTLIGSWLSAWKLKPSTKQRRHPKFYFFDPGVARALSNRLAFGLGDEERGALLECWLYSELRAFLSYTGKNYPIYYWSSHDDVEVDFLLETSEGFVAIEVKAAKRWEKKYARGLNRLRDELGKKRVKRVGVYLGERPVFVDDVGVYPVVDLLRQLWGNELVM